MTPNKAIVWSKAQCPSCIQAKNLLKMKNIEFEERQIGVNWTKEDQLRVVPTARTVPQIFLDDEFVGDYNNLQERLKYVN